MTRAFIIVIDSFGIGGAADAERFGDTGADTLGHIAEACGPLKLPNLNRLGLGRAAQLSTGKLPFGLEDQELLTGAYGFARETSLGKDTPSGHWEMAGLPVDYDWGYFAKTTPCFPDDIIESLIHQGELPGILGNAHASGTQIIDELGLEHIKTGKPICYTSADSVFQIAVHEEHFGLDRLYQICEIAQEILKPLSIGRVIARPFLGDSPSSFKRTSNRRDYTVLPHGPTLLDHVIAGGGEVVSVGKIADIFAHRGITRTLKAGDTDGLVDHLLAEAKSADDGTLVFVNLVDFDSLYGHRRDVSGYARELEEFDLRLPEIEAALRTGDMALITADHGCDPTWPGSDHTRENVPILIFGPGVESRDLGARESFADMGQTLASHLNVAPLAFGKDCFEE